MRWLARAVLLVVVRSLFLTLFALSLALGLHCQTYFPSVLLATDASSTNKLMTEIKIAAGQRTVWKEQGMGFAQRHPNAPRAYHAMKTDGRTTDKPAYVGVSRNGG